MRLLIALLLPLTACATSQPETSSTVTTVAQVRQALDSLSREGEVVRVRGYINSKCYQLGCDLLESPERGEGAGLSLEGMTPIEPQIQRARGRRVIMQARINKPSAYRTPDGSFIITTDRASEITPLSIEK